jgi:CubicO group peptidase (beta-lactamase class C family)
MKKLKRLLIWVLLGFGAISLVLLACGKFYFWKALAYNYVNIDDLDLFPARTVEAAEPAEWPVSRAYNSRSLTGELARELEAFESVAFLVIRQDSVFHEQYWDGYDASSLSNSFSMAKSFISAMIGIAIAEGKIKSLDDRVVDYLPRFDREENRELTIRHLITMSSGLDWDEQYASLFSQTTEAYYGKRLGKQMMRLRVIRTPGERYDYQSCNTQLLGHVLRKATGMKITKYATQKLWIPMHARYDARWSLARKRGVEKAYCCLYSNARDFARIGKLYLDSGRWDGRQIVPEQYVLESIRPAPLLDGDQPNRKYGYHWWLDEIDGHGIFYARGILGQYIIVLPEEDLIIVRLGKKRHKSDDGSLVDVPLYVRETLKMI